MSEKSGYSMFGYVNAHKDLLRVCDYNVFRGYYCGLCKMLGKKFNQITRFGLSYDMTFLAILHSSLMQDKISLKNEICIAHPISKRPVIKEDSGIRYSADMSILLTYYKLKDDWQDEKSLKSFARLFYCFPKKKVEKEYPRQAKAIQENLKKLRSLELQNCKSVEEVSDCFGKLTEAIFDRDGNNRPLALLGYHIGKLIYMTDAYQDIQKDQKKKTYNPFLALYNGCVPLEELKKILSDALLFTLSEIAASYDLLTIYQNKELLDNIIYLGLRKNLESL